MSNQLWWFSSFCFWNIAEPRTSTQSISGHFCWWMDGHILVRWRRFCCFFDNLNSVFFQASENQNVVLALNLRSLLFVKVSRRWHEHLQMMHVPYVVQKVKVMCKMEMRFNDLVYLYKPDIRNACKGTSQDGLTWLPGWLNVLRRQREKKKNSDACIHFRCLHIFEQNLSNNVAMTTLKRLATDFKSSTLKTRLQDPGVTHRALFLWPGARLVRSAV